MSDTDHRDLKMRLRYFPIRIWITSGTWFFGYQVQRTYMAPWENEVLICLIPAVVITVKFGWIGL
jgi:hypothetical protein